MPWVRCGVLLALCFCPVSCLLPTTCPPGCCCPRPGFFVLCESLGLRSLPRSVPPNTSSLSVARNQLCNVDHLLQPFSGLQELSLSHNHLARFPRGLPPSLESLQLQENRITYITSGALRQLGNLTHLDLEDNRIRAIEPGALRGLGRLQFLTLKGNQLTTLPANLPASLTHLDLSANCISALDLPSLSALVNLQVLKINSNCLRSVPESTFDRLPRLRSVELANNLWVCECDILYLYRWLLSGRLKMATDLVCKEPVHLAHRLLLNLSVIAICPWVLKPNERSSHLVSSKQDNNLYPLTVATTTPGVQNVLVNTSDLEGSTNISSNIVERHIEFRYIKGNATNLSKHYSLGTLSYAECLLLNVMQSASPPTVTSTTGTNSPNEQIKCLDNITGHHLTNSTSTEATGLPSTNKADSLPTPKPRLFSKQDSAVVIALLAVLCVMVALLMLAVLLLLKKILIRQQRVAPLEQSQR